MYGTCDICGNEADLVCVGEADVCQECLDECYVYCDNCQGYLTKEDTIVYHLKDGRTLCEECAIYAMNFSGLSEEDVESIESPDEDEE